MFKRIKNWFFKKLSTKALVRMHKVGEYNGKTILFLDLDNSPVVERFAKDIEGKKYYFITYSRIKKQTTVSTAEDWYDMPIMIMFDILKYEKFLVTQNGPNGSLGVSAVSKEYFTFGCLRDILKENYELFHHE